MEHTVLTVFLHFEWSDELALGGKKKKRQKANWVQSYSTEACVPYFTFFMYFYAISRYFVYSLMNKSLGLMKLIMIWSWIENITIRGNSILF